MTMPLDTQPEIEWWRTLELSPHGWGQLYFIDRTTAERFARFLLGDGVDTVAIEHWRNGRRIDVFLVSDEP